MQNFSERRLEQERPEGSLDLAFLRATDILHQDAIDPKTFTKRDPAMVAKHIADEELSIGDFVLTGGELPAMIVVDSISRHIPGVIGKSESLTEESFTLYNKDATIKYIEYPHYTRPEIFEPVEKKKWATPKVLLSGNHKKIHEWRIKNAKLEDGGN